MAYFNNKKVITEPLPIPDDPGYVPPSPPTPPTPSSGSVPIVPRPTFNGTGTVKLYTITSDNNRLDKTLQNETSFTVSFKDDTSIINPVIRLETETDLTYFNYAHISNTNRYYYVDEVVLLKGHLYELHMSVDVLMSFKSGIRNCEGIVKSTEDADYYNMLYNNGSFANQEGRFLSTAVYPYGFDDTATNILITAGG